MQFDSNGFPRFQKRFHVVFLCVFGSALLLFSSVPSTLHAHPPKDVALSYDTQMQVLSVTMTHKVMFPSMHYVQKVVITKNDQVVKTETYTTQPDQGTFTYTYPLALSPGDVVSATATCSILGSGSGRITIGK